MSKRRYRFNITDINALAAAFPLAVTEVHIPARTEFKPNYVVLSKLFDCGVPVPGVEAAEAPAEDAENKGNA